MPIRIWLKIFQSVIEPIALYGSEVWGSLLNHEFEKWNNNPIEALHTEFCKSILRVQRNTPKQRIQGRIRPIMRIERRAIKFGKNLKMSDPNSYHFKALKNHEVNPEQSPLIQMVLKLQAQTNTTNNIQHQDTETKFSPTKLNKHNKKMIQPIGKKQQKNLNVIWP